MSIFEILQTTNLPVAYFEFEGEKPPFPYLTYRGVGSNNFNADNGIHWGGYHYTVEYFYQTKNEELERGLEDIFNAKHLLWEKSEDYKNQDENCYVIVYQIEEA